MSDASQRLDEVRNGIARAAGLAGRRPDEVVLIAVSKTQPAEAIETLIAADQRDFGENRVQEAQGKWLPLRAAYPDVRLHLVGQLQSNKAEDAILLFDAIHSVDRPSLVTALVKAMAKTGRRTDCFLQVNIGDEPQKGGCAVADLPALVDLARDEGLAARRPDVPAATASSRHHFALLAVLARRQRRRRAQHGHVRRL